MVYSVPHVAVSPSLSVETSAPPWVPARKRVRLGLRVRAEDGQPWRHPGPHGWSRGTVQWTDLRTGHSSATTARFQLPPVIPAGVTVDVPVGTSFPVPATPGVYTFQASIPALGITSDVRRVEVRSTILPTSIDAPRLLAATYSVRPVDAPVVVIRGESVRLEIGATNVGAALWLASAHHDRGVVRLAWRWFRDGHELAELSGRAPISYDVFPGQQSRFTVAIATPRSSGTYTLELGLVSERVTLFASVGTLPVRLAVEVRQASEIGFADLVERLRFSETGAPRLTLSTDGIQRRPADLVQLTVRGANGQRRWVVDAGQRLVAYDRNRWTPLGRGAELSSWTRPAGALRVPLAGLAPGDYTWYLLVTEGGSRRIIADARARMEVVP